MRILGNVISVNAPRTDYAETDPTRASFLQNKPEEAIRTAQQTAEEAKSAAEAAAEAALPKSGGAMSGPLSVLAPTEDTHAATKAYVDSKHKVFRLTLLSANWVGATAPYIQSVAVDGIHSSDTPVYGPEYSADQNSRLAQKEAFALVDDLETGEGSVTFTCFEEKPQVDMTIQMEVNR